MYYDERPGWFERAFEALLMFGVLAVFVILALRWLIGL